MAEAHPRPDADADGPTAAGGERDGTTTGGMPRWVRLSLVVVLVVALLFVVGKLTGLGGDHGPGRHGDREEPSSVVGDDGGHRPPVDHGP